MDADELDFPSTAADVPDTFTGAETNDFFAGTAAGADDVEDDFPPTATDVPVTFTGAETSDFLLEAGAELPVEADELDFPNTAADVPDTFTGAETNDFFAGAAAGADDVEDDFPPTATDVPVTLTGAETADFPVAAGVELPPDFDDPRMLIDVPETFTGTETRCLTTPVMDPAGGAEGVLGDSAEAIPAPMAKSPPLRTAVCSPLLSQVFMTFLPDGVLRKNRSTQQRPQGRRPHTAPRRSAPGGRDHG